MRDIMKFIEVFVLIGQIFVEVQSKWVRDVDSKIVDEIQQNPSVAYLIKFHAPWCGHCRKFEPIYEEIAKEVYELSNTVEELKNIRVVRIDATVYTDVANRYDVRGYPTIKLIRASQSFSYENERSKSAVLEFLRRVNGPALRWIPSVGRFNEIRREHDVFFLFLTNETSTETINDPLFKQYQDLVQRYLSQTYFYATNVSLIHQTYFTKYKSDSKSQIFAIKSEGFYLYQAESFYDNVEQFIVKEKVATFPQITSGNIHDLIVTKKLLIIYAFQEHQDVVEKKQKRIELKSQMRQYVMQHLSTLRDTHQFSWSNDLELLSNIAVWTLDEPLIFLYDSVLHKYGIYPLASMIDNQIQIEPILNHIVKNSSEILQYSGDTWTKRIFRPFWELYRMIIAMFTEAPFISLLIIGIPTLVISLICYCLCCSPNESSPSQTKTFKKRHQNGQSDEQEQASMGEDEDDDDYEERIVQIEAKFIENFVKPVDARDIPTWPDESRKSSIEKKQD